MRLIYMGLTKANGIVEANAKNMPEPLLFR